MGSPPESMTLTSVFLRLPKSVISQGADEVQREQEWKKLLDFKPEGFQGPEDVKRLENPDDQWVHDPAVVPEGWLTGQECYWPPYTDPEKVRKAAEKCVAPDLTKWTKHPVNVLKRKGK